MAEPLKYADLRKCFMDGTELLEKLREIARGMGMPTSVSRMQICGKRTYWYREPYVKEADPEISFLMPNRSYVSPYRSVDLLQSSIHHYQHIPDLAVERLVPELGIWDIRQCMFPATDITG